MPSRNRLKQNGRRSAAIIAAALATCAAMNSRAVADTTAEWLNTSGDVWTNPADWSTNPNYPNNGTPGGTNYQALFDLAGSGPYTVTLNSNIAVDGLTLSTANATLNQTLGTLTIGAATISSGTYSLNGGTLSGGAGGATVALSGGGQFQLYSGTLDNLTFSGGNLNFFGNGTTPVTVTNGLNLSGNTLSFQGTSRTIHFDGPGQTIDQLTIDNSTAGATLGTISVGYTNSSSAVTLTMGSGASIHGNFQINDNPSVAGNTLLNNGTLLVDTTGQTLSVGVSNFTNFGTASSANGGTLKLASSNWSNAPSGTISANNSTLNFAGSWSNSGTIQTTGTSNVVLGGTFATSVLGSLNLSANTTASITGTVINTGNTLSVNGFSGIWSVNNGTIVGGTLQLGTTPSPTITAVTLNGTHVAGGDLDFNNANATLAVRGFNPFSATGE